VVRSRSVRLLGLLAAGAVAVPLVGSSAAATAAAPAPAEACPPGYQLTSKTAGERRVEREANSAFTDLLGTLDAATEAAPGCEPLKKPESFEELRALQTESNRLSAGPQGYTPPGALRQALAAKQVLAQAAPNVPGAQGSFTPLGKTPLIADSPQGPAVNGLGLADQAGRVDSFAYDAATNRLWAGKGTGGVWLSTDLGESWRSVGDTLPYQSVGSIGYSPAGGGTLIVLSGEASAGGNVYTGIGAFRSTDGGASWTRASGVPDGLMGFDVEVDPVDPSIIYAATSQGLFRSTDAGASYVNANLPTGDCAGKTGYGDVCQNANWVTDVEINAPGGVGDDTDGGQVIAAVGYRAGQRVYPGTDVPQAPANGLYRSDTGAPGSFALLDVFGDGVSPVGFAPQERVGRVELGGATGPEQDHGFLYAIVQDAVLFNQGGPIGIDVADATEVTGPLPVPNNTALNGIYVSPDFGDSWTRMADEVELQLPITESALVGLSQAQFYAPGIQSWYDMWIEPDPAAAGAGGVPTRLVFGLEELWETRLVGTPQDGLTQALEPASFRVVGPYFSGSTCSFLDLGLPVCPLTGTTPDDTTTHPDQQDGIFVPLPDGGSKLVVGNDGGIYAQELADGASTDKTAWGRGNQAGFGSNTLLPYDASAAKDGTVVFGLQDNGSGHIEPDGTVIETAGGDGFFAAVDPDDSDVYYTETPLAAMQVTQDRGLSFTDIAPPVTAPLFSNPFQMDPTDSQHLITGGPEVVERTTGPAGDWVQVYNTGEGTQVTAVELNAENAYVGFCSTCDIANIADADFNSGIATNVGGDAPPEKGSPSGWRTAAANGLPDRYVTGIAVDPADPRTVYVSLSNYANRQWWPIGSANDKNAEKGPGQVFKSTDAGETFTNISGNLPDVPARSIELNRGQLVVGTDIGMFISNNTDGQRWTAPAGLPNVPVVSVKNHPGKPNSVVLATFGRGVYEYAFSARAGASTPISGPVTAAPGRLPATGGLALGVPAAVAGGLALALGLLALRRRSA
jgi:hypothetical protein